MDKYRFIDLSGLSAFKSKIINYIVAHEYKHPIYTPMESGIYKIAVDSTGHISSASPITKEDLIVLGIQPEYNFEVKTEDGHLYFTPVE